MPDASIVAVAMGRHVAENERDRHRRVFTAIMQDNLGAFASNG